MSDIIRPDDSPELMGEKIAEFLVKCEKAELIVNKITFENNKIVKAEIIV